MTVQTITVPVDPTAEVTVAATTGKLAVLQEIVGGYIQAVGVGNVTIYLDEEGKIKGKEINVRATKLAHRLKLIALHDAIVGDAVVLGFDYESGEHRDAPGCVLTYLEDVAV